jgi:hypothetical protein
MPNETIDTRAQNDTFVALFPVPAQKILFATDLLLELQQAVEQGFSSRRAARDVDVDRDYTVATTNN